MRVLLEHLLELLKGWTVGRTGQVVSILITDGNLALQDYPLIQGNSIYGNDSGPFGSIFNGCIEYLFEMVHRLVLYQIPPSEVNPLCPQG